MVPERALQEQIWKWFHHHFHYIMSVPPIPTQINVWPYGRIDGGSGYASDDINQAVLDRTNLPSEIVAAADMMDNLYETDIKLYAYIFYRSKGYTLKRIDDLGMEFMPFLSRSGRTTLKAKKLNRKAFRLFFSNLPPDQVESWGDEALRRRIAGEI